MEDGQTRPTKKRRKYSEKNLKAAIENVLQSKMTLYRASKVYKIPSTTLKENIGRVKAKYDGSHSNTQVTVLKMGRPYALSIDIDLQIVSYIKEMQELGFVLTVDKIKQLAYKLAEVAGEEHKFSSAKKCAGRKWWANFKERFALSLPTPVCSNPVTLEDFYDKLETTLVQHDLMDCPERIWNCDETGLTFVNKPKKIEGKIGKKYIYNPIYAEKGTTTSVLCCINADGCFIPPMIVFKGVRNIPELSNGSLPNSLTRLSPKGWITANLFLEWLKFFAASIPPARPVMLIMDSQASYVSPSVLDYARSEQIILFTMPADTRHILQPLDVGVFHPLNEAWGEELQSYKYSHPNSNPTRVDFHMFFSPAYTKSFTASNIRAGFKRTSIYPLNKNAKYLEATALSNVTNKPLPSEETTLQEALATPDFDVGNTASPFCEHQKLEPGSNASSPATDKNLDADGCISSIPSTSSSLQNNQASDISDPKSLKTGNNETRVNSSPKRKNITKTAAKQNKASATKRITRNFQKEQKSEEDWICNSCGSKYSDDVLLNSGADWITCSFCLNPYHLPCQGHDVNKNQEVFMCDHCSDDPNDSDSDF